MCIAAGIFLVVSCPSLAGGAPESAGFAALAWKEFYAAKARFQADTNNADAAWQFGRASFVLTEWLTNKAERVGVAEQGIAACRACIAQGAASAPAHYYLGMNLGRVADSRRNLSSLKIVKEMEREFQAAAELDERIAFAGPDRSLGLLYLEAPALISIGSRSRAHRHLQRAVELAPDYPENRLNLIEACLKWRDLTGARKESNALEELWPDARRKFAGETWAAHWDDWEQRSNAVKRRLEQTSKPLKSPRQEE
jgi:tetratricopeptide (TPR) repeat protein